MKNTVSLVTKIAIIVLALLIIGLSGLAIYQYKNEQQKIAELEKLLSDMSDTVEVLDTETKNYVNDTATAQIKSSHYEEIAAFLLKKEKTVDRTDIYSSMDFRWDLMILDMGENNTAKFRGPLESYAPVLSDPSIIDLQSVREKLFGFPVYSCTITAKSPGSTVITFNSSDGGLYEVLVIVL